jgi:diguanylate cyclase (GGDEF)-like protein
MILRSEMSDPAELPEAPGTEAAAQALVSRTPLELRLLHQAFHDPLTNLPNRALFMDRLEHALARIRRAPDAIAVLFLDLDNFKPINDNFGHQTGDQLLISVARRLETCVRPGDTVARLAGDEFTLLLENIVDIEDAFVVADRVLESLRSPVTINQHELLIGASIGIAYSTTGREGSDDLLHNADVAMYRAKHGGKAACRLFDPSMKVDALERQELERELRRAVERGELRLFYQPKVSLETGQIVGMEALVRWQHPQRGLILPSEFMPMAEETGLVNGIGEWVLQEAAVHAREWRPELAGEQPLLMSANLSARQFQDPRLVETVAGALRWARIEPWRLTLEITEDVAMENAEQALETLRQLKELGVRLAFDDFGNGRSSLRYLKQFPIDTLKIARSFIDGLGYDADDMAIVRSILDFAGNLRRNVTAEGVETTEQFFLLRGLGCDEGQGYFFARPLTGDAAAALVAASAPLPFGRAGRGHFPDESGFSGPTPLALPSRPARQLRRAHGRAAS